MDFPLYKEEPANNNDLNDYQEYNITLYELLEQHVLQGTQTWVTQPVVPWYNEGIVQTKAERKRRRMRLPSDFADYKRKRNYPTNLMKKARQEFYMQFIEKNRSNPKKLFNAANKLLRECKQLHFPEHTNKTVLPNDTGKYFVRKIERIRMDIDSIHLHPRDQDVESPDSFTNRMQHSLNNLSECNVSDLIKNSAKNSCLIYDPLDVLLPVITRMANASLSTGHFPDEGRYCEPFTEKKVRRILVSKTYDQ